MSRANRAKRRGAANVRLPFFDQDKLGDNAYGKGVFIRIFKKVAVI